MPFSWKIPQCIGKSIAGGEFAPAKKFIGLLGDMEDELAGFLC